MIGSKRAREPGALTKGDDDFGHRLSEVDHEILKELGVKNSSQFLSPDTRTANFTKVNPNKIEGDQ